MTAFRALKRNDFSEFGPIIPDLEDSEWLLAQRESAEDDSNRGFARRRLEEDGGPEESLRKVREKLEHEFRYARSRTESFIDWSTAEFTGIEESLLKEREAFGVKYVEIYFRVRSGQEEFRFHMNDCLRSPRGWLCSGRIRYVSPASRPVRMRDRKPSGAPAVEDAEPRAK